MSVCMRCSTGPTPIEVAQSIRTNCSRCSQRKPRPDVAVPVEGRATGRVAPAVAVVRVAKMAVTLREAPVVLEVEDRVVVAPAEAGRVDQVVAVPVDLHNPDRSCLPSCKTNCD